MLTDEAGFEALAEEPYSFFLDSALEDSRLGRRAYMGSRPFMVFTARGQPAPARLGEAEDKLVWTGRLEPAEKVDLHVSFRGRGLDYRSLSKEERFAKVSALGEDLMEAIAA